MTADRTSDAGSLNREYLLPSKVKERDRHNCVFHAGVSIQVSHITVEVCHLVPHSKRNEVRSFCPWSLLPCLLSMQYAERLKRYHEVPLEDQMRVVNTSLNAICMKDSWHKYVDRSLVAILPVRSLE